MLGEDAEGCTKLGVLLRRSKAREKRESRDGRRGRSEAKGGGDESTKLSITGLDSRGALQESRKTSTGTIPSVLNKY